MSSSLYQYKFTVFTPTFNRAHTLPRVYKSLKNQTFKDFEWLIVDDGSTDNTEDLIEKWQKEAVFPIRCIRQSNKGKHVAIEKAACEAYGELFLTLDSDDACVPHALERFNFHWQNIPESERKNFSAVTALCLNEEGKPISEKKFPFNPTDSNSLEIKYKYKFNTEAWGFQKTAIMKEFSFQTHIEKSYVPESVIWTQIARRYKTRFVNEYLRIYFVGHPSIMRSALSKKVEGAVLSYIFSLNTNIDYFKYDPFSFFRDAVHLGRFCLHGHKNILKIMREIKPWLSKILYFTGLPISLLLYINDKIMKK